MKKIYKCFVTLSTVVLLASCSNTPKTQTPVSMVALESPTISLKTGDTFDLKPRALDKEKNEINGINFICRSSNPTSVTVDNQGVIAALSKGTATITVMSDTADLKVATCYVTVDGAHSTIKDLKLNKQTLTLFEGNSYTFTATTNPSDAIVDLTWFSDNEEVISVNSGTVIAKKVGTANVTVSCQGYSDSCAITVKESGGEGELKITLDCNEATLLIGNTLQLHATPSQTVTLNWSSSDDGIATVDQFGLVTANKKGSAVITVAAGNVSVSCKITVTDGQPGEEYNLKVYFYIDYNTVDIDNPYAVVDWYTGVPLTNANKPADPTSPTDPAFSKFVGWSSHTIIDDLKDLWDFEKDVVPEGSYTFALYGIWLDA